MKMRNVDKVRRLEKEIAALTEKIGHQNVELARQRELTRMEMSGAKEVVLAADALCVAVARKCGAAVGAEAWELVLPTYDARKMLEEFRLTVTRGDGGYLLRAERRNA